MAKNDKIKPEKTVKGFKIPKDEKTLKKQNTKQTGGSQLDRIESKLDYIIICLEEMGV